MTFDVTNDRDIDISYNPGSLNVILPAVGDGGAVVDTVAGSEPVVNRLVNVRAVSTLVAVDNDVVACENTLTDKAAVCITNPVIRNASAFNVSVVQLLATSRIEYPAAAATNTNRECAAPPSWEYDVDSTVPSDNCNM